MPAMRMAAMPVAACSMIVVVVVVVVVIMIMIVVAVIVVAVIVVVVAMRVAMVIGLTGRISGAGHAGIMPRRRTIRQAVAHDR
jgi:hypothetical protein